MSVSRARLFDYFNNLFSEIARRERLSERNNSSPASVRLNRVGIDDKQWRRWRSGATVLRQNTFIRIRESVVDNPYDRDVLNELYSYYTMSNPETRKGRSERPRDRLTDSEVSFIEAAIFEVGAAGISDLAEPEVFKAFAKRILDPRFSETDTEVGLRSSLVMQKITRSPKLGVKNIALRRKLELAGLWFQLLNADFQDNEREHNAAIQQVASRFGSTADTPLAGYCINAFPAMFHQSSDFSGVSGKMSNKFREASLYRVAMDFAKSFDSQSDSFYVALGIKNIYSSAEYNYLRTQMYLPGSENQKIAQRFLEIDKSDEDQGAPLFMRMYNWIGIADAMMLDCQYDEAYAYLDYRIDEVKNQKDRPSYQIGRAELKKAICKYMLSMSVGGTQRAAHLRDGLKDAEGALTIFRGAGNDTMIAETEAMISRIMKVL